MILVGLTEQRPLSLEIKDNPPEGVKHYFISSQENPVFVRSLRYFSTDLDLIETNDFPCLTNNKWIYNCFGPFCCYAFSMFDYGFPFEIKKGVMNKLYLRDNFKRLIFTSKWAYESALKKPINMPKEILDKSTLIYPAISKMDKVSNPDSDEFKILFVGGNFFNKGGLNVVDAFEKLQKKYENISLTLASELDSEDKISSVYLRKISANKSIKIDYFTKKQMYTEVYPQSNALVLPTLMENGFPYALIEAQAFGLPIIASDVSAIPEVVLDRKNGFIIKNPKIERSFTSKKYNQFTTDKIYEYLSLLIEDNRLRNKMSATSLERARTIFSFEKKNKKMKEVYEEALR